MPNIPPPFPVHILPAPVLPAPVARRLPPGPAPLGRVRPRPGGADRFSMTGGVS